MTDFGGDGRDFRGRWKKGHCPNPNGRPRKQPQVSDADVGWFKQSTVKVVINGEMREVTRHELLLHSMFDQAIKGKSAVISRKLFDRLEEVDKEWAQAREWYREHREIFLENDAKGEFDAKLGNELIAILAITGLQRSRPLKRACAGKPLRRHGAKVRNPRRSSIWKKNGLRPMQHARRRVATREMIPMNADTSWLSREICNANPQTTSPSRLTGASYHDFD